MTKNFADRDTLEATMWDATAPAEPEMGVLDGRVEADVAIIGGNFLRIFKEVVG